MKEDVIITQDPDLLEISVETSPTLNLVNIYMLAFKLKHVCALENVLHVVSMQSHMEAKSCSHRKDQDLKKKAKKKPQTKKGKRATLKSPQEEWYGNIVKMVITLTTQEVLLMRLFFK